MNLSEIKGLGDPFSITIKFVDTETLLYRSKNKELTLNDLQWYKRLDELKDYIKDVKLPERKEYLREAKRSKLSSDSFFIKKYTELDGAVSYSYALLQSHKKILGRLAKKGDLEVLKYFLESLDKEVKENHSEGVKKIRNEIINWALKGAAGSGQLLYPTVFVK